MGVYVCLDHGCGPAEFAAAGHLSLQQSGMRSFVSRQLSDPPYMPLECAKSGLFTGIGAQDFWRICDCRQFGGIVVGVGHVWGAQISKVRLGCRHRAMHDSLIPLVQPVFHHQAMAVCRERAGTDARDGSRNEGSEAQRLALSAQSTLSVQLVKCGLDALFGGECRCGHRHAGTNKRPSAHRSQRRHGTRDSSFSGDRLHQ